MGEGDQDGEREGGVSASEAAAGVASETRTKPVVAAVIAYPPEFPAARSPAPRSLHLARAFPLTTCAKIWCARCSCAAWRACRISEPMW